MAPSPPRWPRVALALGLGAAGGALFFALKLPLPWMLGSMIATLVAAVAGAPVALWLPLRSVMVVVIGVMLGSAFKPAILGQVPGWLPSLAMLVPFVAVSTFIGMAYLRRFARFDRNTAFFAGAPGGLAEMTLLGGANGGDERMIALIHAGRIVVVVAVVPLAFRLFGGYVPSNQVRSLLGGFDLSLVEVAVLAACGALGYYAARWVRIPAPVLVGPAAVSALAHLGGLSAATPPTLVVAVAQIVVGATIGCRFAGVGARTIARVLSVSLGSLALLGCVVALVCLVLHWATGLPWPVLVLAFAPGGLTEMTLVAFALDLDPAFVTTHHVLRIFLVILLVPLAFKLLPPGRGLR